jgi:hypothetical protein
VGVESHRCTPMARRARCAEPASRSGSFWFRTQMVLRPGLGAVAPSARQGSRDPMRRVRRDPPTEESGCSRTRTHAARWLSRLPAPCGATASRSVERELHHVPAGGLRMSPFTSPLRRLPGCRWAAADKSRPSSSRVAGRVLPRSSGKSGAHDTVDRCHALLPGRSHDPSLTPRVRIGERGRAGRARGEPSNDPVGSTDRPGSVKSRGGWVGAAQYGSVSGSMPRPSRRRTWDSSIGGAGVTSRRLVFAQRRRTSRVRRRPDLRPIRLPRPPGDLMPVPVAGAASGGCRPQAPGLHRIAAAPGAARGGVGPCHRRAARRAEGGGSATPPTGRARDAARFCLGRAPCGLPRWGGRISRTDRLPPPCWAPQVSRLPGCGEVPAPAPLLAP